MNTCKTSQGDTWDLLAYRWLGGTESTDRLIAANPEYMGTLVFPAGVALRVPEIIKGGGGSLPPWKR